VDSSKKQRTSVWLLHWIARISGIAAIVPLLMIVFGEPGVGPSGVREWVYLALFPFGFSAGYLLGWRWPIFGGSFSVVCLVLSLLVSGRVFPLAAYLTWGVLAIPAVLFIIAGLMKQKINGVAWSKCCGMVS
jgi:hypothetical protein